MFDGEATSTAVVDNGTGGGEGGGATEGGGEGTLGEVGEGGEGTETETGDGEEGESTSEGEGEEGAEGEEHAEGEEGEGAEGDEDEFSDADGRRVDDQTRKALAALKKVDPKVAAQLAKNYHRTQAIVKDVGAQNLSEAVTKIRGMAATIESLGGEEGITASNEELADYRKEIQQFAEGDPALIEELYKSNAEGFVTTVQNSLDLLAKENPTAFDNAMIPAMASRMENAGLPSAIKEVLGFIKEGKGQEAWDALKKADVWLDKLKGLAGDKMAKRTERNPEAEALTRERAELAKEKQFIADTAVATDVNRLNNKAMSRQVEPFFKEMKLKDKGRRMFVNDVQSSVWAAMKEDKVFQRQAASIKAKGNHAKTAEFVNAKFQELLPDHFRDVRNARYPTYKPVRVALNADGTKKDAPKTNGTNGQPVKPVVVAGVQPTRPKHADVDWTKTSDTDWIKGNAVLANGKRIRFDINAPANRF